MKLPRLLQASKALGGKTFYDRRLYGALAPFFILNSVLSTSHARTFTSASTLAVINVLALVICALYFEIAVRTIFRSKDVKPINLSSMVLFGASLGALKGYATGAIANFSGFEQDFQASIESRIWQTSFVGVLVVLGLSAISLAQKNFQAERDLLVAERVQRLVNRKSTPESAAESHRILRDFVAVAKKRIRNSTNPPSEMIREIVELSLRPLSHELWERENAKYPNFGWSELTQYVILNNKFAPAITSAIYMALIFPYAAFYDGLGQALSRSLLGGLVLFLGLYLAKRANFKKLWVAVPYYFLVQVLTVAILIALSSALVGDLPGVNTMSSGVAVLLLVLQINFSVGIVEVMNDNHKSVRKGMLKLINSQGLDRQALSTQNLLSNRELANYLHGSLQNRLLSAAMRMEQKENDPVTITAELERVETLLDSIDNPSSYLTLEPLRIQTNSLISSWRGFVEISTDEGFPFSTGNSRLDTTFAQAINEAVSNAVRHGLARNVEVSLAHVDNCWHLRVTDDGLGPKTHPSGLGSKFFDSIALGNWTLLPGINGGSELMLKLAH